MLRRDTHTEETSVSFRFVPPVPLSVTAFASTPVRMYVVAWKLISLRPKLLSFEEEAALSEREAR